MNVTGGTPSYGSAWGSRSDDDARDTLLRGSVKLPPGPIKSMRSMRHWCAALSAVRRAVPGSEWTVHLDGSPIPWDEQTGFGGYGAVR